MLNVQVDTGGGGALSVSLSFSLYLYLYLWKNDTNSCGGGRVLSVQVETGGGGAGSTSCSTLATLVTECNSTEEDPTRIGGTFNERVARLRLFDTTKATK